MNMLAIEGKTLVGFFWTSLKDDDLKIMAEKIQRTHSFQYIKIPLTHLHSTPPTKIPTNSFISAF